MYLKKFQCVPSTLLAPFPSSFRRGIAGSTLTSFSVSARPSSRPRTTNFCVESYGWQGTMCVSMVVSAVGALGIQDLAQNVVHRIRFHQPLRPSLLERLRESHTGTSGIFRAEPSKNVREGR